MTENDLTTDVFVLKCTGRGLVVKRPGVLSKVQNAESCLGGGGLFPSSKKHWAGQTFGPPYK